MTRKVVLILILLLALAFIAGYLHFRMTTPIGVGAYYRKTGLLVRGQKLGFEETRYFNITGSTDSHSGPPSTPLIAKDLALVIDHVSYPFSSLTTASLGSLGFVERSTGPDKYEMTSSKGATLLIEKNRLILFSIEYTSSLSSPAILSYRGAPPLKLPLSPKDVVMVFGRPDEIIGGFFRDLAIFVMSLFQR